LKVRIYASEEKATSERSLEIREKSERNYEKWKNQILSRS